MKANEFIKRHGINRAKEVIADTPKRAEYYRDMDSVCDPNEVLYYVWFGCKLLVFNGDKWEPSIYHNDNDYILEQLQCIPDLKRLIESHDFVENYGGLHCAKHSLKLFISSIAMGLYHGVDGANAEMEIPKLKQAIADVESCQ